MHHCAVDGCRNPAARRGLCWGHDKRRRHGLEVNVELRNVRLSRFEQLLECVFRFSELPATDDEGWRRAKHSLRVAATNYAYSQKPRNQHGGVWTPSPTRKKSTSD